MEYNAEQIQIELMGLKNNREITLQNFHQITGAINVLEQMVATLNEKKKEEEMAKIEENSPEIKPVPYTAAENLAPYSGEMINKS